MLSELCVPMIHRGNVLGTINFECRKAGRFSEEDARVAEAFTRERSPKPYTGCGETRTRLGGYRNVTG